MLHIGTVVIIAGEDAKDYLADALSECTGDLSRRIDSIKQELCEMAKTLNDIKNDVAALKTADQSAIALLKGLKARLDEAIASNDPAALTELSAELEGQTADLAAAVVQNTPAAPPAGTP